MRFYLGTHMPNWLGKTDVPLFVSARRLRGRKTFPRALGRWALDSGGFSEISMYGKWETSPEQYAAEATLFQEKIGNLDWAAIQDWMCEPHMLEKTGKSVHEHQVLTIESYSTLRAIAPNIPWMPVLQGWATSDYIKHIAMYRAAGFTDKRFGLGSVCRRQSTDGIGAMIIGLKALGFGIHAFGFKTKGLEVCSDYLDSSDSLAWSYGARYSKPLPGHTHKNCANCLEYALRWRAKLLGTGEYSGALHASQVVQAYTDGVYRVV